MTQNTVQPGLSVPASAAGPWDRPPGSRPSPRPRAIPPAAPAPVPDDVTIGNCPVSGGQSEGAPTPDVSQEEGGGSVQYPVDTPADSVTRSEQVRAGLLAVRAYITPPQVWAEPPASMAELAAYAHWGGWTTSTGTVRRLGIVWHRLVGLPVTTCCRYAEWIAQRPGRAIPVFVLWKLLISTGPGPGFADHVIRPALAAVAWVLL